MIYNNFEKRYFFWRDKESIKIFEFDSNTNPVFKVDEDGEFYTCNCDNVEILDKMFLPKFSEYHKIIEIDLDFNMVVGAKYTVEAV